MREVALLDSFLKICELAVRLNACDLCTFGVRIEMNTLIRLERKANIMVRPVGFGELIRVRAIAVDMPDRRWQAAISEQEHQSMYAFVVVDVEVPKHIGTWAV